MPLIAGSTVTNLLCFITNAGSSVTHGWLALYNSALALVAQSADSTATFTATGMKTLAMTAAYAVPSSGVYYAVVLVTSTVTQPTVASLVGTSAGGASINDQLVSNAWRAFLQTGLAALPNPVVPLSAAGSPWIGAT
jgi:hypothetical protein